MRCRLVVLSCGLLAALGLAVGASDASAHARPARPARAVPVDGRAAAAPAPVTHVHAYVVRSGVSIHWQDPGPSTFDHVVIRYARGYTAPIRSTLGRRVRLSGGRATAARVARLAPGTVYTIAIWTVDAHGRRSTPAERSFTSGVPRGPRGQYVGRVTDDQGHPLRNAKVSATDYTGAGSISAHTRTDSHGRFRLRLVPGSWRVDFGGQHIRGGDSDATGYLSSDARMVVHSGAVVRAGNVALTPGGAVSGRVTDVAGHPLAGVQVDVVPVRPQATNGGESGGVDFEFIYNRSDAVFTASDGRYTIRGVPISKALKVCMATAARPVTGGDSDELGYADRCLPSGVLVPRGGAATEPDLALDGAVGGEVVGTISTPSGTGLSDWLVSFAAGRNGTGQSEGDAVTRPDGTYDAKGLSPGTYQVCAELGEQADTSRTGYVPSCRRALVTVRAAHRATADHALAIAAAVSGRVVGPGGVPIRGAYVQVYDRDFSVGADGRTDATGHYTVKGVPPGERVACVDPSGLRARRLPTGAAFGCYRGGTVFTAPAGAVRTGIDLRLGPAGAISGTVRDSSGKPVPYAEVGVIALDTEGDNDGADGRTDASGHYVVAGLEASKYRVCFQQFSDDLSQSEVCHRGHVPVSLSRTTSGIDAVFPASATASISVTVHDSAGRPVAGVETVALSRCPETDGCRPVPLFNPRTRVSSDATAVTGRTGADVIPGLKPGRYAICLYAYYAAAAAATPQDGYADRCSGSTVAIDARARRTTAIHLNLADGGALSGTVTDGAGHPVAGALIDVTHSAAGDYSNLGFDNGNPATRDPADDSITRPDGSFTVRGVQPGTSLVCADASAATGPDPAGYLDQCLGGAVGSTRAGTAIAVTADQDHGGTDLTVVPAAGISGRVNEPKRNDVFSVDVLVYAGRNRHVIADERTDRDGRYTITGLRAGSYSVCADDFDLEKGQCYRNVAWMDDEDRPPLATTTLVEAGAGGVAGGIDFRLASS